MFYKFRNKINKRYYDIQCKDVLKTPPIPGANDGVIILSAVGNNDLMMYLVAIKSFFRAFGRGRAVVLVPDDFSESNLVMLIHHVNPVKVIRDSDVLVGKCPRGGTWERLVSIVDLIQSNYVIQLDADTVTFGDVSEVIECVERNRSFTIGTWSNQTIESMKVAREHVLQAESQHVQILAEKNFDRLWNFETGRYVRGQSSFSGFAKGGFSRDELERFSVAMAEVLGEQKWKEWGSESLASNYIVSNSGESVVLPFPKYSGYVPGKAIARDRAFVHFEGTHRFRGGVYVRKSMEAIAAL